MRRVVVAIVAIGAMLATAVACRAEPEPVPDSQVSPTPAVADSPSATTPASPDPLADQFEAAKTCIESIGKPGRGRSSGVMVVAGHGYGSHEGTNTGLYPPLVQALSRVAGESSVLGLTGDLSRSGAESSFRQIATEVADWPLVLVAPGNHDVSSPEARSAFEATFGPTWGARRIGDVLVVRLDTDLDDWRLSGDQLAWLEDTLQSPRATKAKSVVVLTHHLIWSLGDGSDFPINGGPCDPLLPRDPNQLQDLLAPLGKPTVVISGDTGAFAEQASLACDHRGGIDYVASGVGGGVQDALLAVDLTATPTLRVCRLDAEDLAACVSG